MTEDLWYYSRDGDEKVGPTPGAHLRQWIGTGQVTDETLVWRPGMDDWMPIQSVGELQSAPPPPAAPQPASLPPAAQRHVPDTKRLLAVLQQIKGALSTRSLLNIVSSKVFWLGVIAVILIKTLAVPFIVSRAVSVWAEGYGIEMSVEDWSDEFFDLSATAHNAVLLVPGSYAEKEFLSAEAIELDLSLWSGLFGGHWAREVRIKEPKIYVERLLSGRWNYEDLMTAPIPPQVSAVIRKAESEGGASTFNGKRELEGQYSFSLTGASVEQMDLEWVENLPGDSKGGMIQELKTTLFIDDISVTTKNLVGLVDLSSQRKSLLNLEARTGSGKISFSGKANLFFWKASHEKVDEVDWMPTLEGKIYLENVGTNAFARLMPDAAIVPEGGTISGTIDLEVAERQVECYAHLNVRDATFTANQASRLVANDASAIDEQLSDYRASGQYQFSCGGRLGEGTYRPFQAFQTNVIRHGVARAPEEVRVLAAVEHGRYSEEPIDPSLADDVERVLDDVDSKWLRWSGLRSRVRNLGSGRNR